MEEAGDRILNNTLIASDPVTPSSVWQQLSPLLSAALDDPHRGLLVFDAQRRLVHLTSSVSNLLGLPQGLGWRDMCLSDFFGRTDLSPGSLAFAESSFVLSQSEESVEPVHLFAKDGSRAMCMRVRSIAEAYTVATVEILNSAASAGNSDKEVVPNEAAPKDALTGLITRLDFEKAVLAALTRAPDKILAVLLIDLDRFKPVNDTLGHAAGDSVLRLVAGRLRSIVRETDCVARLGGDEFALMIHPIAPAADPADIARRIVDLIGRTFLIDGNLVNVGASVGIAMAPHDGTEYEKLLRSADLALYHSKVSGRGTYHFFSAAMETRAQARRTSEMDLRRALSLRQLEVYYQPQVDIQTRRLVGFEALIRWNHPERGLVPPGDFLALAEEIGVIIPIGEWVLKTACREAMKWPDEVLVAVNASPIQFETGRFAASVSNALAGSRLPARRLEIEVTEGILLREERTVIGTMHALRDMGVRIAMDDFGTGYASLSQLARFPFDKIKIDRSLVGPDGDNPKHRAIVRAIAGLGASLGVSTMAEGIETADQLARTLSDGCGSVQGYLFSKPVPAGRLEALIANLLANSLPAKTSGEEKQRELQIV